MLKKLQTNKPLRITTTIIVLAFALIGFVLTTSFFAIKLQWTLTYGFSGSFSLCYCLSLASADQSQRMGRFILLLSFLCCFFFFTVRSLVQLQFFFVVDTNVLTVLTANVQAPFFDGSDDCIDDCIYRFTKPLRKKNSSRNSTTRSFRNFSGAFSL